MSVSEAAEFDLDTYDFRDEIRRAIECAPISDLNTDSAALKTLGAYDELGGFADRPPDTPVTVDDDIEPNGVFTDDINAYPALVHQALEIFHPFLDAGIIDEYTRGSIEHETAHAAAAIKLGIAVSYGVRITKVRLPDHQIEVTVFPSIHYGSEQISKEDMAFIAAAPEKPSESDQHLVRTLGYESCRHALESHPMFPNLSMAVE